MTICLKLNDNVGDIFSMFVSSGNDWIWWQKWWKSSWTSENCHQQISADTCFFAKKILVTSGCWWQVDIGDKLMLVTFSCWQFLDVRDRIWILVSSLGCWCPTVKDRGCWRRKWPRSSTTSQSCHQHFSSRAKLVSNICHQHQSCHHFTWFQWFDLYWWLYFTTHVTCITCFLT